MCNNVNYSRRLNPTREHSENLLAALEGGVSAAFFSSGMAAFATLMELFAPGDEVIATDDLYGGSIWFYNQLSAKKLLTPSSKHTPMSRKRNTKHVALTTSCSASRSGLRRLMILSMIWKGRQDELQF